MPRYDFVLLDADMTLFDFERSEQEALREVLAARGYPTDSGTVDLYLRINSALWDANARGEIDQDFLAAERFAAFMRVKGGGHDPRQFNRDYLEALGRRGYLLPGAEEFCRTLAGAGCTLAIATNGLPAAQWGRFNASPLKGIIPHMFVSMELGCQKPQREYFDKVCAALGITDRRRAVMVGDGLKTDIRGGNAAGIDTLWFNPKGLPADPLIPPTYTAAGYAQALEILLPDQPAAGRFCYRFVS